MFRIKHQDSSLDAGFGDPGIHISGDVRETLTGCIE